MENFDEISPKKSSDIDEKKAQDSAIDAMAQSNKEQSLINFIAQLGKEGIGDTGSDFSKEKQLSENLDMRKKVYSSSSSVDLSSSNDEEDDSDAESTDLDEYESTKLRSQCMDKISDIEKHFGDIKDRYYKEKYNQVTKKLKDVENEIAIEYRNPCKVLEERMDTKLKICDVLKKLRKESIKLLYEAENRANNQHFENEKQMMIDSIRLELQDKIKALQEDRDNVDYSTEIWSNKKSPVGASNNTSTKSSHKKNKRSASPYNFGFNQITKKKKKPVTVTGPYIVYMLKDKEIMDDWAVVKRALVQRKKPVYKSVRMMKPYNSCKLIDNKLLYNGKWFHKGQGVVIDHKDSTTTMAKITSIHGNEIALHHSDSSSSKVYFNQLERGKISIRHKKKWISSKS